MIFMQQGPDQNIQYIDLTKIDDPKNAMRSQMSDEGLQQLTESIRQVGLIEPIILRQTGDRYEVIAGHRRLAAAWRLRYAKIPAVVRVSSDSETAIIRVHENLVREDVDPVSEAIFLAKTMTELGWSAEQCAKEINRSVQYVEDRLAIAEMDDYMQALIKEERIKLGVALALNKIENQKVRYNWTMSAVRDGMTVRGAEEALREYERMADTWDATQTPEEERHAPIEVPMILWDCAKCNQKAPSDQLQFVRIHRGACPDEISV